MRNQLNVQRMRVNWLFFSELIRSTDMVDAEEDVLNLSTIADMIVRDRSGQLFLRCGWPWPIF